MTLYAPLAGDWKALAPEILLSLSGAVLIVLGAFLRRHPRLVNWIAVSIFFLNFLFVLAVLYGRRLQYGAFDGMLGAPSYTWFFVLCGLFSAVMGARWLGKSPLPHSGEFYGILSMAAASLSVFSRSAHLMLTFVALEASAVCFYVLIAWARKQVPSLESSVRYLILSGASGAFFLLGMAFIYGAGLKSGVDFLYYFNFAEAESSRLFYVGLVFVVSGVFFKLSAFPFQFWAPDVYQGAPTPVAAFMAVASKAAAVTVLFGMLRFAYLSERMLAVLCVVAAAGIIIGNLGGLTERNTKRIIGFSGIANAGYIMVLIAALLKAAHIGFATSVDAEFAIKFYLVSYMLGVYGVMFVQNLYSDENDSYLSVSDYGGMWRRSPLSVGVLTVGLSSLAGIPPTAGFFAKLLVVILAVQTGLYGLAAVLVAGSAASIYYYFKWVRAAFDGQGDADYGFEPAEASGPMMLAIAIGSLCMGVMVFAFIG